MITEEINIQFADRLRKLLETLESCHECQKLCEWLSTDAVGGKSMIVLRASWEHSIKTGHEIPVLRLTQEEDPKHLRARIEASFQRSMKR